MAVEKLEEPLIVRPTSKPSSGIRTGIGYSRTATCPSYQSMGQCRALGTANEIVPEDHGVSLQEGPRLTPRRRGEEVCPHARCAQNFRPGSWRCPLFEGQSEREKFAGADHTYSIEAMMGDGQGASGRNLASSRPEFCQGFRCDVSNQRGDKGVGLRHELGIVDSNDRCVNHGARR
jgi:hypothetical protein